MKKILYLVQLPPPTHGVSVCNKLIVESENINSQYTIEVLPIRFSRSITEMQQGSILKYLRVIPLTTRLLSELIFFKPDIVYFSISPLGGAFLRDLLFVTILKLFSCKIIYHLHGKGIEKVSNDLLKRLYRFTFHNTSVICLSNLLVKDIEHVKGNAKIFVCANGVNTEKVSLIESTKNKESIKLLFFSNLLPLKGIKLYLEAVAELINEGFNIEVNIAGPFTEKYTVNEFNTFLNLHVSLKKATKYHGSISGEVKWKILQECHVLVHPTFNDAFPLVILEAMAVGCIIVSTKQGGIPDIIANKPFGFLLEETTQECLVNKLKYILGQKQFFQLWADEAIKEFYEKYHIECFEKKIKHILESVV